MGEPRIFESLYLGTRRPALFQTDRFYHQLRPVHRIIGEDPRFDGNSSTVYYVTAHKPVKFTGTCHIQKPAHDYPYELLNLQGPRDAEQNLIVPKNGGAFTLPKRDLYVRFQRF